MTRILLLLLLPLLAPVAAQAQDSNTRHGFRVGYSYVENEQLDYPHLFVMGYELSQRKRGGAGLDVLFVENVMVSGLNQSKFVPSGNVLVGASIHDTIEIGVGPNLTFMPELTTNMVAAIGVTVPAGEFDVPFHLAWVSDADSMGRVVLTTGVNWGRKRQAAYETHETYGAVDGPSCGEPGGGEMPVQGPPVVVDGDGCP